MSWIRKFLQNHCCEHNYEFIRNIYGDEVNMRDGARSIWQCHKCRKYKYEKELYDKIPLNNKLNEIYDKYEKNLYNEWKKAHKDSLDIITEKLINNASIGCRYLNIILIIDSTTNDEDNYYKWFTENGLEYTKKYDEGQRDLVVQNVEYRIVW